MRNRLTGFFRQTSNAIHAGKLRDKRAEREKEATRGGRGREAAPVPGPTAPLLVIDGVSVEYSPSMDGNPDPGEIVWAWVSYEDDPKQGKDRPVVVVGRRGAGLIGVPLTSKKHDSEPQVAVGTGPWDREGRPSYAKLDRLIALDASTVRREGAVLSRDRFDDVIEGLRRLHS